MQKLFCRKLSVFTAFTKLGYDFADYASSGFQVSKAPAIFGGESKGSPSNDETKKILITALYVSAAFTLTDYIIGEIKRKESRGQSKNKKSSYPNKYF